MRPLRRLVARLRLAREARLLRDVSRLRRLTREFGSAEATRALNADGEMGREESRGRKQESRAGETAHQSAAGTLPSFRPHSVTSAGSPNILYSRLSQSISSYLQSILLKKPS